MKVVVDTSVWIAAVLSNRGASYELFLRALKGEFKLVISHKIYQEFSHVVLRPAIIKKAELTKEEVKKLKYFLKHAKAKVKEKVKIVRDPQDDMFVNCALSFGAQYIISLDKDLLDIRQFKEITFVSPSDFLKILRRHYES